MKNEIEKTIDREDFQALFSESVRQTVEKEKKERSDRLIKYISLIITALTPIAIFSGTWIIAEKQEENTIRLSDQQIKNAAKIADSNNDVAKAIATRNQNIQRLKNATEIFNNITNITHEEDKDYKKRIMLITSLEPYEDEALKFLVHLQNRYKGSDKEKPLADHALQTTINIVTSNQINLSKMEFKPDDKKYQLNMRNSKLVDFNLSESAFEYVNLFNSDFSNSTLVGATFKKADLQKTSFFKSNLEGASFSNSNLKDVNFKMAKIKGMHIENCELRNAKFSLGSLRKLTEPPFQELVEDEPGRDKYINLLSLHLEKITTNIEILQSISKALKMKEDELIERMKENKKESDSYTRLSSALNKLSVVSKIPTQ